MEVEIHWVGKPKATVLATKTCLNWQKPLYSRYSRVIVQNPDIPERIDDTEPAATSRRIEHPVARPREESICRIKKFTHLRRRIVNC